MEANRPKSSEGKTGLVVWLVSLSLSPLFFLAAIASVTQFVIFIDGANTTDLLGQMWIHMPQTITFVLSSIALLIAIFSTKRAMRMRCHRQGPGFYVVETVKSESDQALTFFFAIVVPLITIVVSTDITAFVCFWALVFMIVPLLIRTESGFSNPVLVTLGYNLYRVSFKGHEGRYCLVTKRDVSIGDAIELARIRRNYFFAY